MKSIRPYLAYVSVMDLQLLEDYSARSRALDLTGIDWAAVPRHPLPPEARRVLRYMQDIESGSDALSVYLVADQRRARRDAWLQNGHAPNCRTL